MDERQLELPLINAHKWDVTPIKKYCFIYCGERCDCQRKQPKRYI